MNFTIMQEPVNGKTWCEVYNKHADVYCENTQKVLRYSSRGIGSQLFIKDLANAFKTGAECAGYSIDGNETDAIDMFIASCNYSLSVMFLRCEEALNELAENQYHGTIEGPGYNVSVYDRTSKGVRTFSPLPEALKSLKRLDAIPKKWTLRHVMRMLANGQHVNLETRDRYTDDYAMDAAHNYYKGELCGLDLLKDLSETPSGWWISPAAADGDRLGISCHHFDYKQCTVDLAGVLRKNCPQAEEPQPEPHALEEPEQPTPAVASILMAAPLKPDGAKRMH